MSTSLASVGYQVVVDFVAVVLALGYGYRLGRSGRAGSPRIVAREYLVAGLVGVASFFAAGVLFLEFSIGVRWFDLVLVVRWLVDFVVPFVLAGMAGVPLGSMSGSDATREPATDAEAEPAADADS